MAAKKTTTTTRKPRSKLETKVEFDELRDKLSMEDPDRASQELAKAEKSRVLNSTAGLTAEVALKRLTTTNLEISKVLANTQDELLQAIKQLEDVHDAIHIGEEELQKLHNLDLAATSLENLVEEFKKTKANQEAEEQKTRQAWAEEEQLHRKTVKERDEALARSRKIDEDTYAYVTQKTRQKLKDDVEAEAANLFKQQRDRFDQLEKEMVVRQEVLTKAEAELAELRTKVEAAPAQTKAEVDKAVAIATNSVKRDLTHEFQLKTKDQESQIAILTNKLNAAEADKKVLSEQLLAVNSKLDAAQSRVVEVARSAVESASGQLAMQKMQEVVGSATAGNGGRGSKQ